MDRDKYISLDEKKILDNDIKNQVAELKQQLSDKNKFKIKEEIKDISVMREDGDMNGDE